MQIRISNNISFFAFIIMPSIQPLISGATVPSFSFSEEGNELNINSLIQYCLIYFYPKDDTPGCTKEACAIRDAWADFKKAGLKVLGVSGDNEQSHAKFIEKYQLPFTLIADTNLELARAFGVYGEKKFMGRVYDGIHRISFLVRPGGTIVKTYPKVKPQEHAAQVLEDLAQFSEL